MNGNMKKSISNNSVYVCPIPDIGGYSPASFIGEGSSHGCDSYSGYGFGFDYDADSLTGCGSLTGYGYGCGESCGVGEADSGYG